MKVPPEPVWQPPEAILRRIGGELQRCQTMMHDLETAIAPLMAAAPAGMASHALQDLDRLVQTMSDLVTCLDGLSQDLDGSTRIDAVRLLGRLRLDDLAQRLGGRAVPTAPAEARVALF